MKMIPCLMKEHFLSYKYDAAKVFWFHHCYGCSAFEVRFSRKQIWSVTMWLVTVVDEELPSPYLICSIIASEMLVPVEMKLYEVIQSLCFSNLRCCKTRKSFS